MQLKKYRWSKDYESAEEELVHFLANKGIEAVRWSAEPGEAIAEKTTTASITLWCAEGSLTLTAHGRALSLQPGDTLDIPANTTYSALAGINGCGCYEAATPASPIGA